MKALIDYMAETKQVYAVTSPCLVLSCSWLERRDLSLSLHCQMAVVNMRNVETTACLSDSAPTFKRCRVEQLLLVHPDAAKDEVDPKVFKVNVSPHIIGLWIG